MAKGLIKSIKIQNLFHRLDYEISFKNQYPISLLIGPNGTGKSTILNFIVFLLSPSYKSFQPIEYLDFDEVELELENGYKISLKHKTVNNKDLTASLKSNDYLQNQAMKRINRVTGLSFQIQKKDEASGKETISMRNATDLELLQNAKYLVQSNNDEIEGYRSPSSEIQQKLEGFLEFEGSQYLAYWYRENEEISFAELFDSISTEYPNSSIEERFYATRGLFVYMMEYAILKNNAIAERLQFIRANRSDDAVVYETYQRLSFYLKTAVYMANSSLKGLEKSWKSLMEKTVSSSSVRTFEEYQTALANYKKLKAYNVELGLMEDFADFMDLDIDESGFNNNQKLYGNYLNYIKDALPLADWKLKRFMDVFNKRNDIAEVELFIKKAPENYCLNQMAKKLGKQQEKDYYGNDHYMLMARNTYNPENEFSIFDLSTGQKHDLMMFYSLLFSTAKGETVLIDEPEISQHIDVQEQFVDELLEICQEGDIQALVATHSPYIISNHINMVVDKKVNKNE